MTGANLRGVGRSIARPTRGTSADAAASPDARLLPLERILSLLMRCSFALANSTEVDVMYPMDEPRVVTPGPDPLRILVIGDGPAAGFGVRTHQLGMAGHMARQLASFTGRGVDVRIEAAPARSAHSVFEYIAGAELPECDTAVVMLLATDSLSLVPVAAWRESLVRLLATLRERDVRVVVAATELGAMTHLGLSKRYLAGRHSRQLSDAARRVCNEAGCEFVQLETATHFTSSAYRAWGRTVAEVVASGDFPNANADAEPSLFA